MRLMLGNKQIATLKQSTFTPINNYRTIFVNHSWEQSVCQLLKHEALKASSHYLITGEFITPDYSTIYDNHRNDYIYSLLNPEE